MDITFDWIDVLKLTLAVLIGGAIGAEREMRDKAAGFRTNIMICLGATVFTLMSMKIATNFDDATRIASNIVTGIGFLGAGVIIRERGRVMGLTTASTIWVVAALGMAIGAGAYALAITAAVASLIVLWLLPGFEVMLGSARERRFYRVECEPGEGHFERINKQFTEVGLTVRGLDRTKKDGRWAFQWEVVGRTDQHRRMMQDLVEDDAVVSFEV